MTLSKLTQNYKVVTTSALIIQMTISTTRLLNVRHRQYNLRETGYLQWRDQYCIYTHVVFYYIRIFYSGTVKRAVDNCRPLWSQLVRRPEVCFKRSLGKHLRECWVELITMGFSERLDLIFELSSWTDYVSWSFHCVFILCWNKFLFKPADLSTGFQVWPKSQNLTPNNVARYFQVKSSNCFCVKFSAAFLI